MRSSRRVWPVLVGIVLAVLLGAATPASAHISSVTIDPTGELIGQNRAKAHGTITCIAGEDWELRGVIKQFDGEGTTVYRGVVFRNDVCTGSSQNWNIIGPTGATAGNAQVCYLAKTSLAAGGHDRDRRHDCRYPVVLS